MFRVVSVADFEEQFAELQKRAKEGDNESIYLVKIIEKGIEKLPRARGIKILPEKNRVGLGLY